MTTWGASGDEIATRLPGDELVEDPPYSVTHGITIHGTPADIWPWLLQLGQERGGFYSYQQLENLVGCQIHNIYEIDPTIQIKSVNERVSLGATEAHPSYIVRAIEPEHALVLYGEDPAVKTTWQYVLKPIDAKRTRLLVRSHFAWKPGFVNWLFYAVVVPPLHFIMERKMMLTVKRLVESSVDSIAERQD